MAFNKTYQNYREKFEGSNANEYFVNLGNFINKEVCDVGIELEAQACEILNLIPELQGEKPIMQINRYRILNNKVMHFRNLSNKMLFLTKAHIYKNKASMSKREIATIRMMEGFGKRKIDRIQVKEYCETALDYFGMLVKYGVIPITAGYMEESGYQRLMRE